METFRLQTGDLIPVSAWEGLNLHCRELVLSFFNTDFKHRSLKCNTA